MNKSSVISNCAQLANHNSTLATNHKDVPINSEYIVRIQELNCHKIATFINCFTAAAALPAACCLRDRGHRKQVNCQSGRFIEIRCYVVY